MCLKLHIQGVLGATKDHAIPELSVVNVSFGFSSGFFLESGCKCLRQLLSLRRFLSPDR